MTVASSRLRNTYVARSLPLNDFASAFCQGASGSTNTDPVKLNQVGRGITTALAGWHEHEVYGTQSGFKLFRGSALLQACPKEPFQTRWFPETELFQRWWNLTGHEMRVWEESVLGRSDVPDSKINVCQVPQLVLDLARLFRNRV